jgi:serine acetyltransferase
MRKFLIPRQWILQDWETNAGQPDIRLFLAWFRAAQWAYRHWGALGRLVYSPYTLISSTFLGIEVPVSCTIGPRLRMYHKVGIVIHGECTIGSDCQIRHAVTLGSKFDRKTKTIVFPTVGDDVDLGGGCALLGGIHVGDHAEIGAHAVVTKSVPPRAVVVGNPGRVIRIGDADSNAAGIEAEGSQAGVSLAAARPNLKAAERHAAATARRRARRPRTPQVAISGAGHLVRQGLDRSASNQDEHATTGQASD